MRFLIAVMAAGIAMGQSSNSAGGYPIHSSVVISTAATTTVKATPGTLRKIVVGTQVALATIKLFDIAAAGCIGTPASGAKSVITMPSTIGIPFWLEFHQPFANGICVVTSGATNVAIIFD